MSIIANYKNKRRLTIVPVLIISVITMFSILPTVAAFQNVQSQSDIKPDVEVFTDYDGNIEYVTVDGKLFDMKLLPPKGYDGGVIGIGYVGEYEYSGRFENVYTVLNW